MSEIDRYASTADDELGINALLKPELDENLPTLPGHDHAESIAEEYLRLGGVFQPMPSLHEKRYDTPSSLVRDKD